MTNDHTPINQTMGSFLEMARIWYAIRFKNLELPDVNELFNYTMKVMELAREGRVLMLKLKSKYLENRLVS